MNKQQLLAAVLGVALTTTSCDQVSPPKSSGKDASGKQASKVQFVEMHQYAGRDFCGVAEKLEAAEQFKSQFVRLFGEPRWSTWVAYSANCGALAITTDPKLGDILILEKVELVGNMGANSGKSAALFIHPNGQIEAACFANTGMDGPAEAEWLGKGWRRKEATDQCSYDISPKDKLINIKMAMSPGAQFEVAKYVGKDICEVMGELSSSPALKRSAVTRLGLADWTTWAGYTANCAPIEKVDDADFGELIILPRHDRAYAPMGAVLFVKPDGEVEAGCLSDDGATARWIGTGWSASSTEPQCSPAASTAELLENLRLAKTTGTSAR